MFTMMKTPFAITALLVTLALPSVSVQAQDANNSKLDEIFNEEVVKALLDEASPDTAFMVRLKMLRAHLHAAASALAKGNSAEALQHIKHPRTEIYPEIANALNARGLKEFAHVLDSAEAAFAGGNAQAMSLALAATATELDRAEASIDPASLSSAGILPDAAALLLRTAVVEYHEAFEYSKLSNLVEYHDGAYFVAEASALLKKMETVFAARDPVALSRLQHSLAELSRAWPPEAPPAESVLPVTKMQALVSIIELQINKLR